MYNALLSVFAVVLGTIGTIIAVLSVLKMKLKDVIYARSAIGIDTSELSVLRQVYDARVGIGLVVISGLLQIFCEIYGEITNKLFLGIITVILLFSIVYWISMNIIYKRNKAELLDQMSEKLKSILIDSIIKDDTAKKRSIHKYERLMSVIKVGDNLSFNFEKINKCIDEMISCKSKNEKIKEIKSLICHFEGIMNKSNLYTILTICFAVLIGLCSTLLNKYFNLDMIYFMLSIVIVLTIIAVSVLHRDFKVAYVLKALNFKLEDLNNQNVDESKIADTNNYSE